MRAVFYTALILITLGMAWTLYLNYDLQNFKESFSEVTTTSIEKEVSLSETTSAESDEGIEPAVNDFFQDHSTIDTDSQVNPKVTDGLQIHNSETVRYSEMNVDDQIEKPERSITFNELRNAEEPETQIVGACGEICEPSDVDFFSLPADEQFELTRQDFIKRFGDIPEVHLYIEQLQLAHRGQTIPEDEILKYVRAIVTLFPNEANKKHLKEMEIRVAASRTSQK